MWTWNSVRQAVGTTVWWCEDSDVSALSGANHCWWSCQSLCSNSQKSLVRIYFFPTIPALSPPFIAHSYDAAVLKCKGGAVSKASSMFPSILLRLKHILIHFKEAPPPTHPSLSTATLLKGNITFSG